MTQTLRNQRGQGLIEYLLVVALMGVAAISVLRVVSKNTRANFATISNALQGREERAQTQRAGESTYESRDMSDFMKGVAADE